MTPTSAQLSTGPTTPDGTVAGGRIGSLCSGYGGLEIGLQAVVGGTVAWHVEYDKHPAAVLEARFPGVPNYGDITTTDWSQVEPVDWLTAGYPCQPFSHAGRRKGGTDERHLWPFVADAIGALRPRGVLLENVAGHISLGLDAVLWDLTALGYDATWGVVRASDAGAPHRRERVFIVAADAECSGRGPWPRLRTSDESWIGRGRPGDDGGQVATDADSPGLEGRGRVHAASGEGEAAAHDRGTWLEYEAAITRWSKVVGRPAPQPTETGRSGQRLSPRFVEWMMGLPQGWVTDVSIPRNAQLKALGNGVVPQQAACAVMTLLGLLEFERAA